METTNYKVVDPLQNFNLRVQLLERKLSIDSKSYENTTDIKWSQQIASPRELLTRFIDHENEERFRKQNKELESIIIKQFQNTICIYTIIVSGYGIYHKNKGLVNVQSRLPQNLLEQISFANKFSDSITHLDETKIINRHHKYQLPIHRIMNLINKSNKQTNENIETMFLCVATGVTPELLKFKSIQALQSHETYEEHVLCTIRLFKESNRMEISPGFSSYIIESEAGHILTSTTKMKDISSGGDNRIIASIPTPSLYLDNETIKNAIEKGFRLTPFTFQTSNGIYYDYYLQNFNETLSPNTLQNMRYDDETIRTQQSNRNRSTQLKQQQSDKQWNQPEPIDNYDYSVHTWIDIDTVSGIGLENEEKTYVAYSISKPSHYSVRSSTDPASLIGRTQVSKTKIMQYGHMGRNVSVSAVNALDQGTRYIIGITFFIITCYAAILGPSYPIWLVPAIVILIVLLYGTPGSFSSNSTHRTTILNASKKNEMDRSTKNLSTTSQRYGCETSIVEIKSNRYTSSQHDKNTNIGIVPSTAILNHLLNYNFDVKDLSIEDDTIDSMTSTKEGKSLVMLFETYSIGFMGRHFLKGYGYAVIPDIPGIYELDIHLWKPMGDYKNNMKEFFLGVASQLIDVAFVYKPINPIDEKGCNSSGYNTGQHITYEKVLNKAGVATESTNVTLHIKINVAVVDTRSSSSIETPNLNSTHNINTGSRKGLHKNGSRKSLREEKSLQNVTAKILPSTMQRSVETIISDFKTTMALKRLKGSTSGDDGNSSAASLAPLALPLRGLSNGTSGTSGGLYHSPKRPVSPSRIMTRPGSSTPGGSRSRSVSPTRQASRSVSSGATLADVLARVREKTAAGNTNVNANKSNNSGIIASYSDSVLKESEVSSPLHGNNKQNDQKVFFADDKPLKPKNITKKFDQEVLDTKTTGNNKKQDNKASMDGIAGDNNRRNNILDNEAKQSSETNRKTVAVVVSTELDSKESNFSHDSPPRRVSQPSRYSTHASTNETDSTNDPVESSPTLPAIKKAGSTVPVTVSSQVLEPLSFSPHKDDNKKSNIIVNASALQPLEFKKSSHK